MRVFLLYILFLLGMAGTVGCLSAAKETSKGVISSVIEQIEEGDSFDDASDQAIQIGQANGTSAFTYVGLSLFALGAISFAFFIRDAGIKLMFAGGIAGAVPYVVQSQYFSIITDTAIVLTLLIGVWHLWWKIKQSERSEEATAYNGKEEPKP